MNHFLVEKQILEKLNFAHTFIDKLKVELANLIISKSKRVGVITKDLKEKCLKEVKKEKKDQFRCKFCLKVFSEGRQLGGHVSRAHKNSTIKENYSHGESQKSYTLREKGPIRRLRAKNSRIKERHSEGKNSAMKSANFEPEDSIYMSDC